jgi:hypothetical protein
MPIPKTVKPGRLQGKPRIKDAESLSVPSSAFHRPFTPPPPNPRQPTPAHGRTRGCCGSPR